MIDSAEAAEAWSKYVYAAKNRLMGMPTKLAYELSAIKEANAIKQVLERSVDEALRELSQDVGEN